MRDQISVTSSTQNKVSRKQKKSKRKSSLKMKKFNLCSTIDHRSILVRKNHFKVEQVQKAIPILAQAFANGFFTEVNCRILPESLLEQLAQQVYQFVQRQGAPNHTLILNSFLNEPLLHEHVNKIFVGDFEENQASIKEIHSMNIILYKTKTDDPFHHEVLIEGEKLNFACRWSLPHYQFESLWETLEFDLPLKSQLMQYVFTVIRFDKANIDKTIVHCNQTILLYGPPGCGKTTLCKGLAQKVAIRMKELFSRFYFYELNAGSLFSKWFSESSHNLSRFFDEITRISADPLIFVIILIDEIESLSISRVSSLSSNEPSDMLRVVNTLLTQIDRLKSFSNILILTTSNLIEVIDQALIDRSDLVLFIGPPSTRTTFHIYKACFDELMEKNLIHSKIQSDELNDKLWNLSKLSHGLSGRTLRKLPMIAFSHVQQSDQRIYPEQLFKAIHQQLISHKTTKNYLQSCNDQ